MSTEKTETEVTETNQLTLSSGLDDSLCSGSGDFATERELVDLGIFGVSHRVSIEAARVMSESAEAHFQSAVEHGIISSPNDGGDS